MRKLKMINTLQLSLLLSLFIGAGVAHASVVSVDGPTYDLPNVTGLKSVNVRLSSDQIQQLTSKATSLQPGKGGFQPLTTSLKQCKDFKSKQVNLQHLSRPMFVIADDQASIDWLEKYKNVLEKSNAVGLVIKVKNIEGLKQIRAAAGDLTLYPANGNEVGKMFSINCYPVLISKHLIEH